MRKLLATFVILGLVGCGGSITKTSTNPSSIKIAWINNGNPEALACPDPIHFCVINIEILDKNTNKVYSVPAMQYSITIPYTSDPLVIRTTGQNPDGSVNDSDYKSVPNVAMKVQ